MRLKHGVVVPDQVLCGFVAGDLADKLPAEPGPPHREDGGRPVTDRIVKEREQQVQEQQVQNQDEQVHKM